MVVRFRGGDFDGHVTFSLLVTAVAFAWGKGGSRFRANAHSCDRTA